ncbi:MAG: D-alanyl-D-alanine carboxypeptidase [Cyanobacteria bacterium SW_9_44_58]|nr:MAG: D-alanyl-D-alanine carboxypeptidase [Cyanobacteria bacterium SW_9_44_58]
MFDVISFSFWVGLFTSWQDKAPPLKPVQTLAWEELALFSRPHPPKAMIEEIVPNYLQQLSALGMAVPSQGVWLASDWWIFGQHQGKRLHSAASLTKIATSLAALEVYGANHQFETLVKRTGAIKNGVLQGDLVIEGGGDPFFVWEEAIALANTLHEAGIQKISGDLIITGNFFMNYQQEGETVSRYLAQALHHESWSPPIRRQYQQLPPETPRPEITIAGNAIVKKHDESLKNATTIIRHQSPPLTTILQQMNIYSNNKIAELLAKLVGGAKKVETIVAKTADFPSKEIQLRNGSGLGVDNQLSPRAVVQMLKAIHEKLEKHGKSIAEIFPVTGIEKGTVRDRALPEGITVKTGTLWKVSTLAGVIPTERHGLVYFSILNQNGNIETFRNQQDQLVQQLHEQWKLVPFNQKSAVYLGDSKRNILISSQSN